MQAKRLRSVIATFGTIAILAACAPAAPSPTAAPAKPAATTAPVAPAATTAPAKPAVTAAPAATTAPAKPAVTAAPAATTAPAAAAKPTGAPFKVGVVTAASGVNAALGTDQARGAQIAAKEINEMGGILGRPIQIIERDDKNDAQEAAQQSQQLVTNEKVDILTASVSGAAAAAVNATAKRAGIPYLRPAQSLINKKDDISPLTFYFGLSPWANNWIVLPWLTENFGKRVFIVVSDYIWGLDNHDAVQAWLKANNLQAVGTAKLPLGTADWSPVMPQIRAAKPDVVVAALPGTDQINFFKQATTFGLPKETKIYMVVVDMVWDRELGAQNIAGTYGGMNFYWELQDKLPAAKNFLTRFAKDYPFPPTGYAAYQYVALRAYVDAAKKANSTEPAKVAAALEGMEFDYAVGKSFIRKCDHQLFQPVHIAKGRTDAETKAKNAQPWPQFAYREVIKSVDTDEKYERSCKDQGL